MPSFWLQPGDQRRDVSLQVSGSIIYACELSDSMAMQTLLLDDPSRSMLTDSYNNMDNPQQQPTTNGSNGNGNGKEEYPPVLDIVLKKTDGWDLETRSAVFQQLQEILSHQFGAPQLGREEASNTTPQPGTAVLSSHPVATTMESLLAANASNNHTSLVKVCGYPERMRRKFATDDAPLCLHAMTIYIQDSLYQISTNPTSMEDLEENNNDNLTLDSATKPEIVETTRGHDSNDNTNGDQTATNKHNKNTTKTTTTTTTNTKNRNTHRGADDQSRFAKFVQFLLSEFGGYEALSQKPVLDIAGGAGMLAFELSVRHDIAAIVVDTQPVKFKARQARCVAFRHECLRNLNLDPHGTAHRSPLVHRLKHRFQSRDYVQLQTLLDSSLVLLPVELDDNDNDYTTNNTILTSLNTITRKKSKHNNTETTTALSDDQERLCSLLRNRECSVMVGLHPDQATDHIVDIGLALNIPFAVCPCCVFPRLFVKRQLKSTGQDVRSYEDLCQFLRERHPSIQETVLPFRGRNRVFYWHPPTTTTTTTSTTT